MRTMILIPALLLLASPSSPAAAQAGQNYQRQLQQLWLEEDRRSEMQQQQWELESLERQLHEEREYQRALEREREYEQRQLQIDQGRGSFEVEPYHWYNQPDPWR